MRRRSFIGILGGAAAGWPLGARTQQADRLRLVGALMGIAEGDPEGRVWVSAFRKGLEDAGWVEGRNLRLDLRPLRCGTKHERCQMSSLLSPIRLAADLSNLFRAQEAIRPASRISSRRLAANGSSC